MVAATQREELHPEPARRPQDRKRPKAAENPKVAREHVFFVTMLSAGVRDKGHEAYAALLAGTETVARDAVHEALAYGRELVGHLENAAKLLPPMPKEEPPCRS